MNSSHKNFRVRIVIDIQSFIIILIIKLLSVWNGGFAIGSLAGSIHILRNGFHVPSIFDFTNIPRVNIITNAADTGHASFLSH